MGIENEQRDRVDCIHLVLAVVSITKAAVTTFIVVINTRSMEHA